MNSNKPLLISVPTVLTMQLSKNVCIKFHEDGAIKIDGTNDIVGAALFYEHLEKIAARTVNFAPGKIKKQKNDIIALNKKIYDLNKKIKKMQPAPMVNEKLGLDRFTDE